MPRADGKLEVRYSVFGGYPWGYEYKAVRRPDAPSLGARCLSMPVILVAVSFPLRPMNASEYSDAETLRDGRRLEIRALRPSDRDGMLEAVAHLSPQALQRRFFAPKRAFSEKEIEYFLHVDFVNHVALVAVLAEDGKPVIVGGARYIVTETGCAEVAFAVDDAHQGMGIGTRLMRHLAAIARGAGMTELIAEVLPENTPMLKVFEKSGLRMALSRAEGVQHVVLDLASPAGPGK